MSLNTIPSWVLEIPYDKLDSGEISAEDFMRQIEESKTIPEHVKQNWRDRLNLPPRVDTPV